MFPTIELAEKFVFLAGAIASKQYKPIIVSNVAQNGIVLC